MVSTREHDSRISDGIQVRLLWCEQDGRLWVAVLDTKTGDSFSLEVPDDERPLDVFHHPYAYAAHHSIDTRRGSLRAQPTVSVGRPVAGLRRATINDDRGDRQPGAKKRDGQHPISQRGECHMVISESLIPFHQQAEDVGMYVIAERAREAHRARPHGPPERPSEGTD